MADSPYLSLLAAGGVFASILLACLVVMLYFNQRDKRRKIIVKIKQEGGPRKASEASSPRLWGGSIKGLATALFSKLGDLRKAGNPEEQSRARLNFVRAGFNHQNAAAIFLGAKIFLMAFLTVCFLLTRVMFFYPLEPIAALAILSFCLLAGYALPEFWLRLRLRKRKRTITLGIPDALDLLVVCVDAGMGIDSAFKRVTDNLSRTNKVLEMEFKTFMLELKAGKTRQDALKNMALRSDVEELYGLINLLIQADQLGASIGNALMIFSDDLRNKRMLKAEEIAATIGVKLMFPMMLFIFPSLFVVILGPAMIKLYRLWLNH